MSSGNLYIALLYRQKIKNSGGNDIKFRTGKNQNLLVLVLIAVVATILIYRTAFNSPIPGFDEEALKNSGTQEAHSVNVSDSVFQPSEAIEHTWELQKEPKYGSEHPLYFCVVLGNEGTKSMLGIVDESDGTGTGYDTAYIDENMNGDLTDEAVKKFSQVERGSRAGELEPSIKFEGPFKAGQKATYTLNIYSLTRKNYSRQPGNDYYFHWYLDTGGWNYFFINGKMKFFSNAADAMNSKAVRLGGPCQWNINSGIKDGKPVISAGLKDGNGCTLRILRGAGDSKSPKLSLIKDGKVMAEENMKFG